MKNILLNLVRKVKNISFFGVVYLCGCKGNYKKELSFYLTYLSLHLEAIVLTLVLISFLYALHIASKSLFTGQMCTRVQPDEVFSEDVEQVTVSDLTDEIFILKVQFII